MDCDDQISYLEPIESITIDVAHNRGIVQPRSGQSMSTPLNFPDTRNPLLITEMLYSIADHTLQITTPAGENVVIDIALPGRETRRSGQHVVYLDQGHWSAIARHLQDPAALSTGDAAAADKLIDWANTGQIILPVSSGHVVETTPLYGPKRQAVALAMLKLSRGWHMRSPVVVRSDEIMRVLEADGPTAHACPEVFTLDPDTLYVSGIAPPVPEDLPGYIGWLCQRLTSVAANFALLIDPERIPSEKNTGWCERLAEIGRNPDFRAMPTHRRRAAAQVEALSDAMAEVSVLTQLQRLARSAEQAAAALLEGLQEHHETMPFLRLFSDALGVRLFNPTTKWVPKRSGRHALSRVCGGLRGCCCGGAHGIALSVRRVAGPAGSVPCRADVE